ncbi:hypothetical protein LINGRAHAP2_LOCUS10815 [Linum grandiflorum]
MEFLNVLSYNGIPEHQLRFMQYSIVVFLRNSNPAASLCNDTRISVRHLGKKSIIPRIMLDKSDPKWPFTLKRWKYPLCLCYGMTMNKNVGQILDQIYIFSPTQVFTHGQLYVPL